MKMIVLDDEPIIRRGIIHKIRGAGLPIEIAGEAGDGIAGLELVRAMRPDVVITDIEMPGMSGLDIIREAKIIDPALEFVIVSGYDNFAYAEKAIRYGVSRYLLKPLNDQELRETLAELAEKQDTGQARGRSYRELRVLEASSREALRQLELTQFLQGEVATVSDERLLALAARRARFSATVLLLDSVSLPHGSFSLGEDELLAFAIKNIVTEQFAAAGIHGVLIHHALHRREFVYVAGLSAAQDREAIGQALERILYGIRKYLKLQATAGIGSFVGALPHIRDSYQEAKHAARSAVLHGTGRFYFYDDKARLPNRISVFGDEDRELVSAWLELREADKLHRWIDRRIGAIVQNPASVYVQHGLTSFPRLLKQRSRWVQGHYQVWKRIGALWRSDSRFITKLDCTVYLLMIVTPLILAADYALGFASLLGWVNAYSRSMEWLDQFGSWVPATVHVHLVLAFSIQLLFLPAYSKVARVKIPWYATPGLMATFAIYTASIWILASIIAFYRMATGKWGWIKTEREKVSTNTSTA